MNARALVVCGLLACLLPAGCQPLNENREVKVEAYGVRSLIFSEPRYDQKVTVEVHSPGNPVSAYLVKGADQEKAESGLLNHKAPAGALAGKEKAEEITLEATVPAKTEYALILHNPGKSDATVKVKVTGR
jgi:hypothetical protein